METEGEGRESKRTKETGNGKEKGWVKNGNRTIVKEIITELKKLIYSLKTRLKYGEKMPHQKYQRRCIVSTKNK